MKDKNKYKHKTNNETYIQDTHVNKNDFVKNIQNEILVIGSIFKKPDLYIEYGKYINPYFDFADEVTYFLYNNISIMYETFSQDMNLKNTNIFMSQDEDRFKKYKQYGGYNLIEQWKQMADEVDFKNYFQQLKKYSVLRWYQKKGVDVNKIINHPKFNKFTAVNIVTLITAKLNEVQVDVLANEDSKGLGEDVVNHVNDRLIKPNAGIDSPFELLNQMFRGLRKEKMICIGYLSNEGKTRLLIKMLAYIAFIEDKRVLMLANEMSEADCKACLLTTVINNKEFHNLHGIKMIKPEREIELGQYRDDNTNQFIERYMDDEGNYTESIEDYMQRQTKSSQEYRNVIKVSQWIENHFNKKILFKNISKDYSDKNIKLEIEKHHKIHNIEYIAYDTLKGFRTDNWEMVKQTTTMLKELMEQLKCFNLSTIQLTDDTVFTDMHSLSSMNIANAKQLKHVLDHLILGKRLDKEDYNKYKYIPTNVYGEQPTKQPLKLDMNKTYHGWKIDKNRAGKKDKILLFEVDLDLNTWYEVGYLANSKLSF